MFHGFAYWLIKDIEKLISPKLTLISANGLTGAMRNKLYYSINAL